MAAMINFLAKGFSPLFKQSKPGPQQVVEPKNKRQFRSCYKLLFAWMQKLNVIRGQKKTEVEVDTPEVDTLDRRLWEPIHEIPNEAFQKLLVSHIAPPQHASKALLATGIIARIEGSYHHVVVVGFVVNRQLKEYIIKVPAIGSASRWTEKDAYMFRAEVQVMKYLRIETYVPVPYVVAFDDSLSNELGAPFIIMEALPGKTADFIWTDKDSDVDTGYLLADRPSEETKTKRVNFLRSLASILSELQEIEFDKIGIPLFSQDDWDEDVHSVSHYFKWFNKMRFIDHRQFDTLSSSKELFKSTLEEAEEDADDETRHYTAGVCKVMDIILSTPVFASSEQQTFVLRHDDLDLQNILTDEEGNVTGIIDWDGCLAVPRCIGYATLPTFLRRDMLDFDWDRAPHMTFELDRYRAIYADAMRTTGCPDAKYTRKSHLYQGVIGVLHEGYDPEEFVTKILVKIPGSLYCDPAGFLERLGKGWPDAEQFLKEEITKLFEVDEEVSTEEAVQSPVPESNQATETTEPATSSE